MENKRGRERRERSETKRNIINSNSEKKKDRHNGKDREERDR